MLRVLFFCGVFTDLLVDDCVSVHEQQSNKDQLANIFSHLELRLSVLKGTV